MGPNGGDADGDGDAAGPRGPAANEPRIVREVHVARGGGAVPVQRVINVAGKIVGARVVREEIPQETAIAAAEVTGLAAGTLDAEAKSNEHRRRETLRDVAHGSAVILIVLLVIMAGVAMCIIAFHWLTPESIHFLTPAQIDRLEGLGTAAVASSLLTTYGRRLVDKL